MAALPVLATAAGQQPLWHPIRDADRLAAYRAAAGPLPVWWDRCVAPVWELSVVLGRGRGDMTPPLLGFFAHPPKKV